jgi:hypothetical protein
MWKWEKRKVGNWNEQTFGPLGAFHSRSASLEGGKSLNYQLDNLIQPNQLNKLNQSVNSTNALTFATEAILGQSEAGLHAADGLGRQSDFIF